MGTNEVAAPEWVYLALSESRDLAATICERAGASLLPLEERRFERGEFKLRPLQSVRDRRAVVLQTLAASDGAPIADRLVRLLFLLAGLRDAGARERIACIPYLAYARKDRRTQVRDPVNTRYVAELLEAVGAQRIVTLDVHNPAALDNAFRVPVDHLSAIPMFADLFARSLGGLPLAVLSPDVGGVKRAQVFRERLEQRVGGSVELAFVGKRRVGDQVSGETLVGDVQGRTVIVIDDLCATGGTLVRAARIAREAGAAGVRVAFTHAPVSDGVDRLLAEAAIDGIATTDSTGERRLIERAHHGATTADRLVVLPVGLLIGTALRRVREGRALAPLLERWPLAGP